MDPSYTLEQELSLLLPQHVRLYLNAFEDLTLELDSGEIHTPVTPIRAFPLTWKDRFIVLKNSQDEELGVIPSLAALDPESRRVLAAELDRVYFTPIITRINDIEERFHIPKWDVETDRGPRVFEIRSTREIRMLEAGRILIRDADGNQYEIPDYHKLDAVSQALIETRT